MIKMYLYYKNISWIITGPENDPLMDSWRISFSRTPVFLSNRLRQTPLYRFIALQKICGSFPWNSMNTNCNFFVILLLEHKSFSPNLHQDLWLFGIVISNWSLWKLLFWELPVHYANACSNHTVRAMAQPIQVMSLTTKCHLFQ